MTNMASFQSVPKSVVIRILFFVVILALIVSLGVVQVQAKATTFTTDQQVSTNMRVFVPCAAAGAGEYVQLSGSLHIVFVTTLDGAGGFQSRYEFQPNGVFGKGLSTGQMYQGTGTAQGTVRGTLGATSSFADSFKVSGPGGNFLVRAEVQVGISRKGGLTVTVNNFSVTCKRPGYPSYPG